MVKKRMYFEIRKLCDQGKNKTEIADFLKITRKTVKKYLNMNARKYKKYQTKLLNRTKQFEIFKEDIIEIYEINDSKKLYKSSVYDYLEEKYQEMPGTEKTLRNYISHLKQNNEISIDNTCRVYKKVPELPYGKQMQLDFGEYKQSNDKKLYIFAALLSASRYKFVKFQETPFKTIDVISLLLECFDYFGGKPKEIVIDQDKLMVVSENYGDIVYTKDFKYFIDEMDLKMYVCRKADPETKGKVENLVKYVKVNFLNTRTFELLEEANKSGFNWLNRRANGKISQANKKIPLVEIEEERKHLNVLKNSIFRKDSCFGREERIVNDNYISVSSNYYGLPGKYNGKQIEIYVTKYKLFIFDQITEKEITVYDLSLFSGKKIMHREFKRETETSANELKKEVKEYFKDELWEQFLKNNFKNYARYIRDQCLEARKYFNKKNIDTIILLEALKFCISNKTFSIANLHDTYQHYLTYHKQAKEELGNDDYMKKLYNGIHHNQAKIPVHTRSLEDYSNHISEGGTQ